MLDNSKIREQFKILSQKKNGFELAYFDSAATSQKPNSVIEAITSFYEKMNANVNRGVYELSEAATIAYESARNKVAKFINSENEEIVFVRNSTEAANLIAYSFGEIAIEEGDEIIISELEHHSNLLPWLNLAKRKKANVKVWPINSKFELEISDLKKLISKRTKIVALTQMSNVTGTVTPVMEAVKIAHENEAVIVLDCAQGIAHLGLDVKQLDIDFAFASGHKMFAETGTGFLYGKKEILEKMPAFLVGGGMVKEIEETSFETLDLPMKFEAGTPDIAGAISLGKAIEFITEIGFEKIKEHEDVLKKKLIAILKNFPDLKTYTSDSKDSGPIVSFSIQGIHPHDIATIFNEFNIAIRAGHHCAKPLMKKLDLTACARISLSIYNTEEEVARVELAIKRALEIFKKN